MDLPWRAEYAKSGTSSCKGCERSIAKYELRMAIMVQSPLFDEKVPNWYHFRCFFAKFKVKSEAHVSHFESLRWDDQEKIRVKITSATPETPKGNGRESSTGVPGNSGPTEIGEFLTDYAKSNRSYCKGCKETIAKGQARISKIDRESIKAKRFGPHPAWHHVDCFAQAKEELKFFEDGSKIPGFLTLRVEDQRIIKEKLKEVDVLPYKSLRRDDQEKIRGSITSESSATPKGNERESSTGVPGNSGPTEIGEFLTEYARSNRSFCKGCKERIAIGQARISKIDRESNSARRFGPSPAWHHVDCFAQAKEELKFFEDGSKIPGFRYLRVEDQRVIKEKLKEIDVLPEKKMKTEDIREILDGEKKKLKEQSQMVYEWRDSLKKHLKKKRMIELLEYNDQEIPVGESKILDRLSDIMAFGALVPCAKCDQGQFVFASDGYHCTGNLTDWSKCLNVTKLPARKPFLIPNEFKEEFPFLKSYKYKKLDRYFPANAHTPTVKKTIPSTSGIKRAPQPLDNAKIVSVGDCKRRKKTIARV